MLQQNNNNNHPCLSGAAPAVLHGCSRAAPPFTSRLELGDLPLLRGLRAWALCSRSRCKPSGEQPAAATGRRVPCPRPADLYLRGGWGSGGYGLPLCVDARQAGIGALMTVATLKTSEGNGKTQTQCLFLRTEKGSCLYPAAKPGSVPPWPRGGGGMGSAPPAQPATQWANRACSGRRWRRSGMAGTRDPSREEEPGRGEKLPAPQQEEAYPATPSPPRPQPSWQPGGPRGDSQVKEWREDEEEAGSGARNHGDGGGVRHDKEPSSGTLMLPEVGTVAAIRPRSYGTIVEPENPGGPTGGGCCSAADRQGEACCHSNRRGPEGSAAEPEEEGEEKEGGGMGVLQEGVPHRTDSGGNTGGGGTSRADEDLPLGEGVGGRVKQDPGADISLAPPAAKPTSSTPLAGATVISPPCPEAVEGRLGAAGGRNGTGDLESLERRAGEEEEEEEEDEFGLFMQAEADRSVPVHHGSKESVGKAEGNCVASGWKQSWTAGAFHQSDDGWAAFPQDVPDGGQDPAGQWWPASSKEENREPSHSCLAALFAEAFPSPSGSSSSSSAHDPGHAASVPTLTQLLRGRASSDHSDQGLLDRFYDLNKIAGRHRRGGGVTSSLLLRTLHLRQPLTDSRPVPPTSPSSSLSSANQHPWSTVAKRRLSYDCNRNME